MNSYQKEQFETYLTVSHLIDHFIPPQEKENLISMAGDYLEFRKRTKDFLSTHFDKICNLKCYKNRHSACCSREGINIFFADVVVNILLSQRDEIALLLAALEKPNKGYKCIYLGTVGCMWRIKPIVCEMFLCESAKIETFSDNPLLREEWEDMKQQRKKYTWPDTPVLFDRLEEYFINAGYRSPLMYLHNSPGLLNVKRNAKKAKNQNWTAPQI